LECALKVPQLMVLSVLSGLVTSLRDAHHFCLSSSSCQCNARCDAMQRWDGVATRCGALPSFNSLNCLPACRWSWSAVSIICQLATGHGAPRLVAHLPVGTPFATPTLCAAVLLPSARSSSWVGPAEKLVHCPFCGAPSWVACVRSFSPNKPHALPGRWLARLHLARCGPAG
jgi:hypothetical protein